MCSPRRWPRDARPRQVGRPRQAEDLPGAVLPVRRRRGRGRAPADRLPGRGQAPLQVRAVPPAGHRQGARLHPDARGARLVRERPDRRRDRHRRHAVPGRQRLDGDHRPRPRAAAADPPAVRGPPRRRRHPAGGAGRRRPPRTRTTWSARAGCTWRSSGSPTRPSTASSRRRCSGCCATSARRSRTGRRCTRRPSASPTTLDAAKLPVSENEVEEARELLEWLADEHFTFLGYREYDFTMERRPGHPARRPGTGLGILRPDPKPRERRLLPPEVSAKAREKQAADPDQGELALHGAPLVVPGLRRHQAVRRERRARPRVPLHRSALVHGVHRERHAGAGTAAQGAGAVPR